MTHDVRIPPKRRADLAAGVIWLRAEDGDCMGVGDTVRPLACPSPRVMCERRIARIDWFTDAAPVGAGRTRDSAFVRLWLE